MVAAARTQMVVTFDTACSEKAIAQTPALCLRASDFNATSAEGKSRIRQYRCIPMLLVRQAWLI